MEHDSRHPKLLNFICPGLGFACYGWPILGLVFFVLSFPLFFWAYVFLLWKPLVGLCFLLLWDGFLALFTPSGDATMWDN